MLQAGRQADRKTDRETDKHMDRQGCRHSTCCRERRKGETTRHMKSSSRRSCQEENGSLSVKATRSSHLPLLSPRQGQTPSPAPGSVYRSGLLIVSCDGYRSGTSIKPNDNQLAGLPACRCRCRRLFLFLCPFYGFISGTWLLSSPPPSFSLLSRTIFPLFWRKS